MSGIMRRLALGVTWGLAATVFCVATGRQIRDGESVEVYFVALVLMFLSECAFDWAASK